MLGWRLELELLTSQTGIRNSVEQRRIVLRHGLTYLAIICICVSVSFHIIFGSCYKRDCFINVKWLSGVQRSVLPSFHFCYKKTSACSAIARLARVELYTCSVFLTMIRDHRPTCAIVYHSHSLHKYYFEVVHCLRYILHVVTTELYRVK